MLFKIYSAVVLLITIGLFIIALNLDISWDFPRLFLMGIFLLMGLTTSAVTLFFYLIEKEESHLISKEDELYESDYFTF